MAMAGDSLALFVDMPECPACGGFLRGITAGVTLKQGVLSKFARKCPTCDVVLLCEATLAPVFTARREREQKRKAVTEGMERYGERNGYHTTNGDGKDHS